MDNWVIALIGFVIGSLSVPVCIVFGVIIWELLNQRRRKP